MESDSESKNDSSDEFSVRNTVIWMANYAESKGETCIYQESLAKRFSCEIKAARIMFWNLYLRRLVEFDGHKTYVVVKPELIDERNSYFAPIDRWERAAKRVKTSWLGPPLYFVTTFLPIAISILALIVSSLALWARWPDSPDKSSTDDRPDDSAKPAATAPALPTVETDTPAEVGVD